MRKTAKQDREYDAFKNLVDKVLTVPHSEIRAGLDAEKAAKKQKKSKRRSG